MGRKREEGEHVTLLRGLVMDDVRVAWVGRGG